MKKNLKMLGNQSEKKRFLSLDEKSQEMQTWFESAAKGADPGVYDILYKLNSLDGVCTVQSCIGHEIIKNNNEKYVQSGCIEMRLDKYRTEQFYNAMPTIKNFDYIEDVIISWRPGYQIQSVLFKPGNISEVSDILISVFEG